ncbi:uncharacterized protein LOC105768540 [Gossypium raimondii]|uniref:DC1 domain-containing protein n=1 Tax=Gossypium raimondii TaxID=29730 RepID=A0A7J8NRP4_GOSRA|nr:uncharacterized protein LOC105768540 [Gossypium raimondii]MBA0579661.1 hypothetical protein [Gossypium raimondii]
MGKLSHDLHIQHFSHPHLLELTNIQALNLNPCSACKLQSSGWMYTCRPCNFALHTSCSQLPHLITHPAHPGHSLSLLPAPAYPVGYFNCDACGQRGHGFNYHCNQCDFDIHSVCASKPLSIHCHSHPCQLQLFFYPPYQTKGFSCDVCHQIGSNHWLYRCSICEFDVHMSCVNTAASIYKGTTRQGNVQFQAWDSFPGSAQSNLQYRNGGAPMNCQYQNNGAAAGNGLMGVAVQGFVEGAAQQVGQNLVQSLMGGGGDSNNGGDNNSSSSSSASMVDVGSSLLSGVFGNS